VTVGLPPVTRFEQNTEFLTLAAL